MVSHQPLNLSSLMEASREIVRLISDNGAYVGERDVDPIVLGFLNARFGKVDRQHHIYMYGSHVPSRIDFRRRGPNAVVLELAVRPAYGGPQLLGYSNASELRKLTRVRNAALRVLMLLDLSAHPHSKSELEASYREVKHTQGKFTRKPVQCLYVSIASACRFRWRPPGW